MAEIENAIVSNSPTNLDTAVLQVNDHIDHIDHIPRPKPKPVRRCGHCRQPGHSIGSCADPSISVKVQMVLDAADYCLAYQPANLFLHIRLRSLNLPMLKMVALRFSNIHTGRDAITNALVDILYNTPKLLPGYQERAKIAIDASDNGSALANIDELLTGIYKSTIESTINFHNHQDISILTKPTCPREQTMFDALLMPRLEQRRLDTHLQVQYLRRAYDRARDGLAQSREQLRFIDELYQTTMQRMPARPRYYKLKVNMVLNNNINAIATNIENMECPICYDTHSEQNMIMTNCSHKFCQGCMIKTLDVANTAINSLNSTANSRKVRCAMCRVLTTSLTFQTPEIMNAFV